MLFEAALVSFLAALGALSSHLDFELVEVAACFANLALDLLDCALRADLKVTQQENVHLF